MTCVDNKLSSAVSNKSTITTYYDTANTWQCVFDPVAGTLTVTNTAGPQNKGDWSGVLHSVAFSTWTDAPSTTSRVVRVEVLDKAEDDDFGCQDKLPQPTCTSSCPAACDITDFGCDWVVLAKPSASMLSCAWTAANATSLGSCHTCDQWSVGHKYDPTATVSPADDALVRRVTVSLTPADDPPFITAESPLTFDENSQPVATIKMFIQDGSTKFNISDFDGISDGFKTLTMTFNNNPASPPIAAYRIPRTSTTPSVLTDNAKQLLLDQETDTTISSQGPVYVSTEDSFMYQCGSDNTFTSCLVQTNYLPPSATTCYLEDSTTSPDGLTYRMCWYRDGRAASIGTLLPPGTLEITTTGVSGSKCMTAAGLKYIMQRIYYQNAEEYLPDLRPREVVVQLTDCTGARVAGACTEIDIRLLDDARERPAHHPGHLGRGHVRRVVAVLEPVLRPDDPDRHYQHGSDPDV